MAVTTIRVDAAVRDRLAQRARAHGRTPAAELAALLDTAEESAWWADAKASARRLHADPAAWADYLAEAEELNGGIADDGPSRVAEDWPEYQSPDHWPESLRALRRGRR